MNTGPLYSLAYMAFVLTWLFGAFDNQYKKSTVRIIQALVIMATLVCQMAGVGITGGA